MPNIRVIKDASDFIFLLPNGGFLMEPPRVLITTFKSIFSSPLLPKGFFLKEELVKIVFQGGDDSKVNNRLGILKFNKIFAIRNVIMESFGKRGTPSLEILRNIIKRKVQNRRV